MSKRKRAYKPNPCDSGFVLLESLVSLMIVTVFVGGVVPFFFSFFHTRETAVREVELNRYLYESALFWRTDSPLTSFSSHAIKATSYQTNRSISIISEEEVVQTLSLKTVEWERSEP